MQINKSPFLSDSWYIEHNDTFVKEAWLNNDLVWCYTLPMTSFESVSYDAGIWTDIALCKETGDLLISGSNRLSYSNDDGETWGARYDFSIGSVDSINTIACGVSGANHSWLTVECQMSGAQPSQYKITKAKNYFTSNAMPPTRKSDWNTSYMPFPLSGGLDFAEMIYSDYWERFIAIGQPIVNNFQNLHYPITQETTDIATSLIGLSSIIGGYLPSSSTTLNGTWLSAGLFINGTPILGEGGYSDVLEISAFANHRIVACGSGGFTKFGYSDDGGATWNKAPYPPTGGADSLQNLHAWSSLAYGQDGGVVLPLSGRVIATNVNTDFFDNASVPQPVKPFAYSDDGINWVGTGLNIAQRGWGPAIYKNGWFVVFPAGGSAAGWMAFSKNGIDWKSINMLPSSPSSLIRTKYTGVVATNNRFIAITTNAAVALADYYYPPNS